MPLLDPQTQLLSFTTNKQVQPNQGVCAIARLYTTPDWLVLFMSRRHFVSSFGRANKTFPDPASPPKINATLLQILKFGGQ